MESQCCRLDQLIHIEHVYAVAFMRLCAVLSLERPLRNTCYWFEVFYNSVHNTRKITPLLVTPTQLLPFTRMEKHRSKVKFHNFCKTKKKKTPENITPAFSQL